ncbi:MAG TPA: ATP-binding protein, partial [Burkholderiaceae bacterium]|nr:ATP-binding protein [Burkholderiaceae bacterium]
LALVYPLWSWQRLRTAVRYLSAESRLAHPAAAKIANIRGGDELDRNMLAMSGAVEHLRALQRFVRDSFDGLPDATLVADGGGVILLANALAVHDFEALGLHKPRGHTLREALEVACDRDDRVIISELASADTPQAFEIEIVAKDRRDMLVKYAPWRRNKTGFDGWIVSFIDITSVREAERQRDEAMRFISHDIRAPQTSIIALLDMHGPACRASLDSCTVERIRAYARQTLSLAEEFTLLAQAESMRYEPTRMDVADVLMQAVDQHWALAKLRGIEFVTRILKTPAPCLGEPAMLRRALANLVSNAVKYSPPKGRVECTLQAVDDMLRVSVRDHGRGIAPQEQGRLFQKFGRAGAEDPDRPDGIGLGLAYVKAVAVRHEGSVGLRSAPGEGAEFFMMLPLHEAPPVAPAVTKVEGSDNDDDDDDDDEDDDD